MAEKPLRIEDRNGTRLGGVRRSVNQAEPEDEIVTVDLATAEESLEGGPIATRITERAGIGNNDHARLREVSSLAFPAELVDGVQVLFEILDRIHVDVALVEKGVQIRTRRQAEQGTELIAGNAAETVSFHTHGLQDGAGAVLTWGEGGAEIGGDFSVDPHTLILTRYCRRARLGVRVPVQPFLNLVVGQYRKGAGSVHRGSSRKPNRQGHGPREVPGAKSALLSGVACQPADAPRVPESDAATACYYATPEYFRVPPV